MSEMTWRKVPSSIGRSVVPSQVDPSGIRFCTLGAAASTCSRLPSACEIGTGTPRGVCERFDTSSQLTCSL